MRMSNMWNCSGCGETNEKSKWRKLNGVNMYECPCCKRELHTTQIHNAVDYSGALGAVEKQGPAGIPFVSNAKALCNCGGENVSELIKVTHNPNRGHILGKGGCFRKEAVGGLVPSDFRYNETYGYNECKVNGYYITVFTLLHQRCYSFHEEAGIWSLPKDESSVNSIEMND
jgi:hypothetical protein